MFGMQARTIIVPALAALALACDAQSASFFEPDAAYAATTGSASVANTTIVLVHGAWADGSAWEGMIPILQREGYKVVAVQNPLSSMATDVETTKRVIDRETGMGRNVVVVAHSYGGAVMSGAAADNPRVKALVYIAAFAPDAGEPLDAFLQRYPNDLGTAFEPDAAGFAYLKADRFRATFAADLPEKQTRVMEAAQHPINLAILGQSNPVAAWRTVPSWFVVAKQDKVINPDLERFYAKRMNARVTEIDASHCVFLSRQNQVAKIILEAAATVANGPQ